MNMTGDPNQQIRPTVFGDEYNYSAPNTDWNRFTASAGFYNQQNFPFSSNFGSAPVTFPIPMNNDKCAPNYLSQNLPQSPTMPFPSTSQNIYGRKNRVNFDYHRCSKRKTNSPPPQPSKQHITEEKMAEHLSKLHISSETSTISEAEENRLKRLYMCEEMLKLQTESILPTSILHNIQRPCTALVLWTPPQRLILENENNIENNNEDEVPDHNLMEMDSRCMD